jgi:hypothetical protein
MDDAIINFAQQLQVRLKQIDPVRDRATVEWVHRFLISLVEQIEKSIPALALKQLGSSQSDLDELELIIKKLRGSVAV